MTSSEKNIRVIFAGGGTGGHVYPALAIHESLVDALGDDQVSALFVGARGGLEARLLPELGVDVRLLPGRGVRGASLANKLLAPIDTARGVAACMRTIRDFRPDVVVGTGGYASVSMVVAAVLTGTPRILQEQNSVPGLVNRRMARFADMVLLSYEESTSAVPRGVKTAVIGNPLRRIPTTDRATGAAFFGLDPGKATVLVIGGSRGAHSLNVAAAAAAGELVDEMGAQFILLTGDGDYGDVAKSFEGNGGVAVRSYVAEVYNAYAAADVAVARAGASSVFELATVGMPSVFVPYPYAADDHQRLNVEALRTAGGAVVVADADLDGSRLAAELRALLGDESRRAGMSGAMKNWVKQDAASAAAGHIVELVKKNAEPGAAHDTPGARHEAAAVRMRG
jgi:UDP-N-acetylglucosamine--N-acetylmuramyl-(pentapeptide) pyrophosphoryl-undecaprenol N-acetylglucosamine transferase